jgi:hypothetical protein
VNRTVNEQKRPVYVHFKFLLEPAWFIHLSQHNRPATSLATIAG